MGAKAPKRIIRPKVKTVGRQPTNKGSSPLLSAKSQVDRDSQKWLFAQGREEKSLVGTGPKESRKLARESNRRTTDSPSRNQRVGYPSPRCVRRPVKKFTGHFLRFARGRGLPFISIIPHFKYFVKHFYAKNKKYFFLKISKNIWQIILFVV